MPSDSTTPVDRITEDELAAVTRDTGTRVVRSNGSWWVENKRCFFRPLLPFTEISPEDSDYPARSWLGGVQHCVPDAAPSNSQKHYFVYDHPQTYRLDSLPHGRANKIRKGLKLFQWRRFADHASFVGHAHPIYLSFAKRTRYHFKRERQDIRHFARWAHGLFAHPKVNVYGAYLSDRLHAVSVFHLVGRLFVNGVYFSDEASMPLQVHDFVLHQLRTAAAATDADLVYMGPYTGVDGIDRAKMIRGCRLITQRTHLRLNPLVAVALRLFRPNIYAGLLGHNSTTPPTGDDRPSPD